MDFHGLMGYSWKMDEWGFRIFLEKLLEMNIFEMGMGYSMGGWKMNGIFLGD